MYNSCNGIVHMCSGVPYGTVEEASRQCVEANACRYTYFKNILGTLKKAGTAEKTATMPKNTNVRGKDAYQ